MILRFCLYSVFKNLRFADPFLVIYFLHLELSYLAIGQLLGYQHLLTAVLEIPTGVLADRWGRRSTLAVSFGFYVVAFSLYGWTASHDSPPLAWLFACVTCFGFGEAMRTGSHKAIMLDYLDSTGQSDRATEVIALARSYSKFSSAVAALAGGIMLAVFHGFAILFWLSALTSAAGAIVVMGYPKESEGETERQRSAGSLRFDGRGLAQWRRSARELTQQPGFWRLFIQSVIFESQVKVVIKYYVQPFLKVGLNSAGIAVVVEAAEKGLTSGMGSVWIGVSECVRDALGGFGAKISHRWEQQFSHRYHALNAVYLASLGATVGVGVCAWWLPTLLIPGVLALIFLTMLQNMRRPVFVAALNEVMNKPQRATTLSLESQARAVGVALSLPLVGWAADNWGISVVFIATAFILAIGVAIRPQATK